LDDLYAGEYYEGSNRYFEDQGTPPSSDHLELAYRVKRLLGTSQGKRSLDVGCGGGRQVEAFAKVGFDACGVEPSTASVELASSLNRNVSCEGIQDVNDSTYDCLTAIHVLEHVSDPRWFVAEMFRAAAPGAIVVIEVPNFASKASVRMGKDWYPLHPSTHLFHFSPKTLEQVCRSVGFRTVKIRRLGGAGMFNDVSESVVSKKPAGSPPHAVSAKPASPKSLKSLLWRLRGPVLQLPGARNLLRWVNWELLGHGQYVQIIARKP
tara:strand:- start:4405 stop:5199 length:795 start_codon:yes stop_codon:yes gene_type:complete